MQGVGQAAQSAPADVAVKAAGARIRWGLVVTQGPQDGRVPIEFLNGPFEHVAGGQGQAATGTKGSIGKDRNERAAGGTAVGLAAGNEKLKCAVHGDFSPGAPAAGLFDMHGLEERARLVGREQAVDSGSLSERDQAVGPEAGHVQGSREGCHSREVGDIVTVRRKRHIGRDATVHEEFERACGEVETAGTPYAVVGGLAAFETDLDKCGLQDAERIGRRRIDECSVGEDRKTPVVALAGDAVEKGTEAGMQEGLTAGERDVDWDRRPRRASEEGDELLNSIENGEEHRQ